jgi:hypothetical protein
LSSNQPPPSLTKNPAANGFTPLYQPSAPSNANTNGLFVPQVDTSNSAVSFVSIDDGFGNLQRVSTDSAMDGIVALKANDPKRYARILDLVKRNGFTTFEDALETASFDRNSMSRSWEDWAAERANNPVIAAEYAKASRGSGGPTNQTNIQTTLSSASQAGAILDENFKSELGRTGTAEEAAAFQQALNEQQRKNPSVSRSVGYQSGSGTGRTNTTTTSGFDYGRFAQEYARSQEGYAEQFAGIRFMEILDQAISSPNSIEKIVQGGLNG